MSTFRRSTRAARASSPGLSTPGDRSGCHLSTGRERAVSCGETNSAGCERAGAFVLPPVPVGIDMHGHEILQADTLGTIAILALVEIQYGYSKLVEHHWRVRRRVHQAEHQIDITWERVHVFLGLTSPFFAAFFGLYGVLFDTSRSTERPVAGSMPTLAYRRVGGLPCSELPSPGIPPKFERRTLELVKLSTKSDGCRWIQGADGGRSGGAGASTSSPLRLPPMLLLWVTSGVVVPRRTSSAECSSSS
eukprot:5272659-Prymnesium_polylepis.4